MSAEVLRLFLAVPLHQVFLEEIKALIIPLRAKFPEIKWAEPDQVHLTLHFFGSTPASEVARIDQAMRNILPRFHPVRVNLSDAGAFPDLRRPRVLWVGIEERTGTLLELQKAVQHGVRRLGFEIESRPFKPHATIGRVKNPPHGSSIQDEIKKINAAFPSAEKTLDHFVLYQSRLLPEGARYEVLKTFPLAQPA